MDLRHHVRRAGGTLALRNLLKHPYTFAKEPYISVTSTTAQSAPNLYTNVTHINASFRRYCVYG